MKRKIYRFVPLVFVLALVITYFVAMHVAGFRGFAEPPKVGEKADAVIERLGGPHYDSRTDGDPPGKYRLGYTDGIGTRPHLLVEDGTVAAIEYSSR